MKSLRGSKHLFSLFVFLLFGFSFLVVITVAASKGFALPDKNSGGWFYEYQTAFTGVIALITAIIIGFQYSDGLYRRRLSARAKMNDALSELCSYATKCFATILDQHQVPMPEKCKESIQIMENAIEFLDRGSSDSVYELIVHHQVHNSRLERALENNNTDNGDQLLYDAVKLYALTTRLFGYARRSDRYYRDVSSVKNEELTLDQMHSALNAVYGFHRSIMAQDDVQFEGLIELINSRHS